MLHECIFGGLGWRTKILKFAPFCFSNFQENWCQDNNSSQCSTTQLSLRFQVAMETTLRHC